MIDFLDYVYFCVRFTMQFASICYYCSLAALPLTKSTSISVKLLEQRILSIFAFPYAFSAASNWEAHDRTFHSRIWLLLEVKGLNYASTIEEDGASHKGHQMPHIIKLAKGLTVRLTHASNYPLALKLLGPATSVRRDLVVAALCGQPGSTFVHFTHHTNP